jgi:hypothetical protein
MLALDSTFTALKQLFAPYADRLRIVADSESTYMLEGEYDPALHRPRFFGGVRAGAHQVSLYLMPVYSNPELIGGISDDLRRRLYGKSVFHFTRPDDHLIEEVRALIEVAFRHYERSGFVT